MIQYYIVGLILLVAAVFALRKMLRVLAGKDSDGCAFCPKNTEPCTDEIKPPRPGRCSANCPGCDKADAGNADHSLRA